MESNEQLTENEINESWLEMAKILDKKYAGYRKDRFFQIHPSVDGDVAGVKIILKNEDESFYYPVEGRINFAEQEMSPLAAQTFLADYMDLYFEEFFIEEEALYIPIDWTTFEYEATNFQMRGQILNRKLEGMADALLGIN